jgi:hypothetical protein
MPANTPQSRRRSLLRCLSCGESVETDPTDLLKYMRIGWPKCCGQVMELYVPAAKPVFPEDDTSEVTPVPPPPAG